MFCVLCLFSPGGVEMAPSSRGSTAMAACLTWCPSRRTRAPFPHTHTGRGAPFTGTAGPAAPGRPSELTAPITATAAPTTRPPSPSRGAAPTTRPPSPSRRAAQPGCPCISPAQTHSSRPRTQPGPTTHCPPPPAPAHPASTGSATQV